MHFQIHREGRVHLTSLHSGGGDWRWALIDDEGAVVAKGEGYESKAACLAAVEMVKTVTASTAVIDRVN